MKPRQSPAGFFLLQCLGETGATFEQAAGVTTEGEHSRQTHKKYAILVRASHLSGISSEDPPYARV